MAKGENTLPAAYYRNRKCKRLCLCVTALHDADWKGARAGLRFEREVLSVESPAPSSPEAGGRHDAAASPEEAAEVRLDASISDLADIAEAEEAIQGGQREEELGGRLSELRGGAEQAADSSRRTRSVFGRKPRASR